MEDSRDKESQRGGKIPSRSEWSEGGGGTMRRKRRRGKVSDKNGEVDDNERSETTRRSRGEGESYDVFLWSPPAWSDHRAMLEQ